MEDSWKNNNSYSSRQMSNSLIGMNESSKKIVQMQPANKVVVMVNKNNMELKDLLNSNIKDIISY